MRRFIIPLLTASLFACSPANQTAPVTPVIEASIEPAPVTVDKGAWLVTLPGGWKYDDVTKPNANGVMTEVLSAESQQKVGRGPISLVLYTVKHKPTMSEEEFAVTVSLSSEEIFDAQAIKAVMTDVSSHPATITLLANPERGAGLLVLATSNKGTGYILTCGGDATKPAGAVAGQMCFDVLKTFRVK